MLQYKGLTKKQQDIQRHNRFLQRVWKMPTEERKNHSQCVACLTDFLDKSAEENASPMIILACDHPMHLACFEKHAFAYMQINGIPAVRDLPNDLPLDQCIFHIQNELKLREGGAPCPMCRLQFPFQHMSVFLNK